MKLHHLVATVAVAASLAAPAEARRASQMFAPANDEITGAMDLKSSQALVAGHLLFASRQTGEPRVDAASIGRTVWYRFTPKVSGRTVVMVAPNRAANLPFRLAVYAGNAIGSLTLRGSAASPPARTRRPPWCSTRSPASPTRSRSTAARRPSSTATS